MSDIQKPIFELHMIGEVKPQTVPASVLGEFLIEVEKSILAVLGEDTEMGSETALVSLVGVKEGSNALSLASPATVIPAVGIIADAIVRQDYDRIPRKAHVHLYEAVKICQRHGWGVQFVQNEKYGIPEATVAPGKGIPKPGVPKKAKGTTTIVGKVIKAGGVDPKVHIKELGTEVSLHIAVTEVLAKELAGRLYETVSLECRVAWNMDEWTYDTSSISVLRLTEYRQPQKTKRAFQALRESAGSQWDGVDPTAYLNDLYQGEVSSEVSEK